MNKVLIGLVAGAAGVAALVIGLFSNHWVIGNEYGIDTHVGLRELELCQVVQPDLDEAGVGVCSTVSHGDIANSPSAIDGFNTFSMVAQITFYTGLVCAGILLLVMALTLARKFPSRGIAPSSLGIVLSFGTLILIAITLAIHPWKQVGWGTGYSIMIAGGGAVACLFAAIMLGRARPRVDDSW
jgi:hypothetical protein